MKLFALVSVVAFSVSAGMAFSQTNRPNVQVQPGYFCAQNKCVRFSSDLQSVSVQGRKPVSVASYGLSQNPVISSETFKDIFQLALRQNGVGAGEDR